MIELSNVSKTYGSGDSAVHALQNVNLTIPKGTIHGVIGLSGAGKSTLIRCVNLLERPTSGSVLVDGQEMTGLRRRELNQARHRIGMIFQHFNLLTTRTVFDNVALPLELMGEKRSAIKNRVLPLLEMVGLADKAKQYPAQLSGGQKQRIALARALVGKPKLLLLDEATSALDGATEDAVMEAIHNLSHQKTIITIAVTN